MNKLGVAIIGTGNIAGSHAEGYLAFPERCRIVALCDIFPEKPRAFAEKHGLSDCTITADYKELLDREDISLVSVCLPPSLHAEVSIAFMESGKDVLCEKPMASSLEEADLMNEARKRTGRLLSIMTCPLYQGQLLLVQGNELLHALVERDLGQ